MQRRRLNLHPSVGTAHLPVAEPVDQDSDDLGDNPRHAGAGDSGRGVDAEIDEQSAAGHAVRNEGHGNEGTGALSAPQAEDLLLGCDHRPAPDFIGVCRLGSLADANDYPRYVAENAFLGFVLVEVEMGAIFRFVEDVARLG
jgi:hypothetical protein